MTPLPNIVVVCGTTGVGKSQLAIDIARELNGEVINADSMQLYRGLDILTNKVTLEEQAGVPHALLGFVAPPREYHVGEFVADAQREIARVLAEGKLPVVAGGTAYYVQNLLFEGKLALAEDRESLVADPLLRLHQHELLSSRVARLSADHLDLLRAVLSLPNTPSPTTLPADFPYERLPTSLRSPGLLAEAFYSVLQTLDPDMAARWHPRDIRKVRRNVEICLEQGKPASEVVAEQAEPAARYRALVIWLRADEDTLFERLDKRVDRMVQNGLMDEVRLLRRLREAQGGGEDSVTSGIFQAIGYREFLGYLEPPCGCAPADKHMVLPTEADRLAHAIERTQLSTRQYAKKQLQWLQRRILPAALASPDMLVASLDATDLSTWSAEVQRPAVSFVRDWLAGRNLPPLDQSARAVIASSHSPETPGLEAKKLEICEVCSTATGQPVRLAPSQLAIHLKSRAHRYRAKPNSKTSAA